METSLLEHLVCKVTVEASFQDLAGENGKAIELFVEF